MDLNLPPHSPIPTTISLSRWSAMVGLAKRVTIDEPGKYIPQFMRISDWFLERRAECKVQNSEGSLFTLHFELCTLNSELVFDRPSPHPK
jgi:hypothetical protein